MALTNDGGIDGFSNPDDTVLVDRESIGSANLADSALASSVGANVCDATLAGSHLDNKPGLVGQEDRPFRRTQIFGKT